MGPRVIETHNTHCTFIRGKPSNKFPRVHSQIWAQDVIMGLNKWAGPSRMFRKVGISDDVFQQNTVSLWGFDKVRFFYLFFMGTRADSVLDDRGSLCQRGLP